MSHISAESFIGSLIYGMSQIKKFSFLICLMYKVSHILDVSYIGLIIKKVVTLNEPKYGEWSEWTDCQAFGRNKNICHKRRVRHCKGGQVGYHAGCPKGKNVESNSCTCPGQSKESLSDSGNSGSWENWGSWGACSKRCGEGSRERFRKCAGGAVGTGSCRFDQWKGKAQIYL